MVDDVPAVGKVEDAVAGVAEVEGVDETTASGVALAAESVIPEAAAVEGAAAVAASPASVTPSLAAFALRARASSIILFLLASAIRSSSFMP